jgi:putative nucleotidyltransferase with HDIG domain
MALKEIKIRIPDLEVGMYVSRLDKPWLETEFLFQGFFIGSQDDIDRLAGQFEYVYVDVEQSRPSESTVVLFAQSSSRKTSASVSDKESLTGIKPREHPIQSSFDEELIKARDSYQELTTTVSGILDSLTVGDHKEVNYPALKSAVEPMVESIVRNPDAYAWLTRMRLKDNRSYQHSVNTAIWAVALGRHLGFPKPELTLLALGGLLFDIGKIRLPEKLLQKTGPYNKYELKIMQEHVQHGVAILRETPGIDDRILEMVFTHHERHDGSGYPQGLKGNAIPIFGKIAGIVDSYVSITSGRPYAATLSPHEAVKKLYEWREVDFQSELVEQLIQVIGVYPVGTVVEISDGRIGVVVVQNKEWRLKPQVMLLRDAHKKPLGSYEVLDLYAAGQEPGSEPLHIKRGVDPEPYGIDPDEYYL